MRHGCSILMAYLLTGYWYQVNSAKAVDKDVKVLKAKLSDEGVLDMSLEAKVLEWQGKGFSITILIFHLVLILRSYRKLKPHY